MQNKKSKRSRYIGSNGNNGNNGGGGGSNTAASAFGQAALLERKDERKDDSAGRVDRLLASAHTMPVMVCCRRTFVDWKALLSHTLSSRWCSHS